jgi:hypothetical protein
MKMMNNKPILTNEEIKKLEHAYTMGATHLEAIYETGIAEERIDLWRSIDGGANDKIIDGWRLKRKWEKKRAIEEAFDCIKGKLKEDEKTAQWYLTHNKESKKDWSDRIEHTGADGEDLFTSLADFLKAVK